MQNNKLYMYKMDRDEESEDDDESKQGSDDVPDKTAEDEEDLPREEVQTYLSTLTYNGALNKATESRWLRCCGERS